MNIVLQSSSAQRAVFKFCILFLAVCSTTAKAKVSDFSTKTSSIHLLENKGQVVDQYLHARADIDFRLLTTGGPSVFIGAGTIHYQFCKADPALPVNEKSNSAQDFAKHKHAHDAGAYTIYRMDVELLGANKSAAAVKTDESEYYETYYNNRLNGAIAHTFSKVTYKDIYPDIDWVIYAKGGELKHEFLVHEGGKVADIQIRYAGATQLRLDNKGALIAETPMGSVTEQAPQTWQGDGKRVDSRFILNDNIVSYAVGQYSGELVVDPALSWATYYGGNGIDYTNSVTTDATGNVYVAGCTYSTESIATTGTHQQTFASMVGSPDCFVAKFSNSGNRLWATYCGGSNTEHGIDVAVDNTNNSVYLCGITISPDGIATPGAHKNSLPVIAEDGFLVKFNSSGIRQWGTYIGGNYAERAYGVATDASGSVYVCGDAYDTSDIVTPGGHQTVFGGAMDGFLIKFNSSGVRQWGTFYGGIGFDEIYSLAIDATNNIYCTGVSRSPSGISTSGSHQPVHGGPIGYEDAFIVKFNSGGTRLWGTYYGGTGEDYASNIATDGTGNIYVSGHTKSSDGIATAGSHKSVLGANYEAFLVKFNNNGSRLWGTYFGGSQDDYGISVTANANSVFLAGFTNSPLGITTIDAHKSTLNGPTDGYLAHFSTSGVLQYGSYFGGPGEEHLFSAGCDNSGNLYLTGYTTSNTDIATPGAHDEIFTTSQDAFLAKFNGFPVSVLDQEKSKRPGLFLYPNPAMARITIDAPSEGEITISSIDGRIIIQRIVVRGQSFIDLNEDMAPGVYFCNFYGKDGEKEVVKLVYRLGGE